ncbi:MAG: preprotein translocase subunit SecE [Aquabacterium sp.]|jgi:preprotein translocase subunit SecE|nr:MAG: preprotein translocase subunit SecE [Aquabacterium sp.]
MTNPSVETVSTGADKAKVAAAVLLVVLGIAAFYLLGKQALWMRLVALFALLGGGVAVFFASESGKELIGFGRESWREMKKVVWPTRQEATQMTLYVFLFVFVMSLFLYLSDKAIEKIIFSFILGWKS